MIKKQHVNQILKNILKQRVNFQLKSIVYLVLLYIVSNVCPFCIKKHSKEYKVNKIFTNAQKKVYQELDIVNILRTIRMVKMFFWSKLTQR